MRIEYYYGLNFVPVYGKCTLVFFLSFPGKKHFLSPETRE